MVKTVRLPNEYNVKKVHWKSREFETFCPLGQDHCTHQFEVDVKCIRYIFDLYLLDDWITENIAGKELTMEGAAYTLYHYLVDELQPEELTVKCLNGAGGYIVEI